MFPLRNRRNAIHRNSSRLSPSELGFFTWEKARGDPDDVYCTLENDVIHVY